ncbi:alpha-D-ribose 1-methylphosphonate 5-triphosphate diphosphatase [Roseovarius salis]|uniref:alpha-D-ribose 1-methylphosphonate 5-triphosphate diphosphatase n=1 Tax=Roseovarius salis TaxID=3376063 RepID=UPI0037C8C09C
MTSKPPAMRLTGATVLRGGEMQARSVVIEGGRISKGPLPEVDLTGYLVLPGIIDLHGDAFERHIRPRPGAVFSLEQGLIATDREAAAHGVTTAWLSQGWSWEGGHRDPGVAEQVLAVLDEYRPRVQTDLRVQLRCETHTVDTQDRLLEAIARHKVRYVIFGNRLDDTPSPSLWPDHELAACARSAGRTPDQHITAIREARKQAAAVPRHLCTLAAAFDEMGVLYGSHDDRDAETRETYSMIGARICEFPQTRAAAKLALAVGDPVVMGAPNVLRGGSCSGHVSAQRLIEAGECDVLVSDYCYPALAKAAFSLVDRGLLGLPRAWNMISQRPAEIMRMTDRGVIAEGKRADLVIVNESTRDIEATLVAGRISHLTGEAARRFLGAPAGLAMAAE